jgi:hypothetical protein
MKKVFISLAAAAALCLASCSDWTKTESLGYKRPTPTEADPAAYREYLAALREYKNSEHPVTMLTVKSVEVPMLQNQHLTSLPDSVDYIMLKGITGLSPVTVSEMQQVRDEKGTKVFCVADYASIVEGWNALWQGTAEDPNALDDRTVEEFAAYCAAQTELQLSYFDKYGFDGLEISYLGNQATEMSRKGQEVFMSGIAAWRASHSDAPLIFRGYWRNLQDQTILTACDYLVTVPLNIVTVATEMDGYVQDQLRGMTGDEIKEVRERIIYEVVIPDIKDPQKIGVTPQTAATWAITPLADNTPERNLFTKRGIAIDNAQDDYYNVAMIYQNIRQAVGIMTPRPEETPTE